MKFSHIADKPLSFLPLIERMQEQALQAFNRYADTRRVYHHFALSRRTVERVEELGKGEGMEQSDIAVVSLAAWILQMPLDAGGLSLAEITPTPHHLSKAQELLKKVDCPQDFQAGVLELVRIFNSVLTMRRFLSNPQLQLLHDAYLAARFGPEFEEEWPYLLLEKELLSGEEVDVDEEKKRFLSTVSKIQYFTAYAKLHYAPILTRHLLWLQKEVKKNTRKHSEPSALARKFQKIERKIPSSGIQTFFRANYRNHINLSSIADNKAHIMISVNAILISVLISVISYKNITESQPEILMPVVIFLITGLTSLIFAVLSARPKVTAFRQMPEKEEYKRNLVFFGKFVARPIEDYEEAIDEVFQSGELLYANLVRDLYHLGVVLDKKYRYLSISYNIFMLGFVATVLTFLLALFI